MTGRPTKYKEEFCKQVEKLCLLGATDQDIANFFNTCIATISNWKNEHPLFLEAIKKGKEIADMRVAESLYKRAIGYKHKEDKIFQHNGEPVVVPTIKHYPPDPVAMIFWLKNRASAKWRDKQNIEHSGTITVDLIDDEQEN